MLSWTFPTEEAVWTVADRTNQKGSRKVAELLSPGSPDPTCNVSLNLIRESWKKMRLLSSVLLTTGYSDLSDTQQLFKPTEALF